jgi:phosphonate transport system permease protein
MLAPQQHPSLARYSRARPWGHWVALFTIGLLVVASFAAADWDFSSLSHPDKRAASLRRMGNWISAFTSPNFSGDFLLHSAKLTLQTLSTALLGTFLAVLLGFLIALGSSRAVMIGEEHGEGWWRAFPLRSPAAALCALCRLLQDVLRAVPDFVWAVILVAVVGLGPLAGALALALNVSGILAKVYSELWDSVEERDYEQARGLGAGRLVTFFYGISPLAARGVQSFTLMRAECAIRNAAVIGVVGGGGLGADIWYQIQFGNWDKVSTLILFTLALTLTADVASNFIRRQLRSDPNHPRASKPTSTWRTLSRSYVGIAFALSLVAWSLWFMAFGKNAPPGQNDQNYLAPATKLLKGENWGNLSFFERLLQPELDLPALGITSTNGPDQPTSGRGTVDLFSSYGPLDFYRPSAWAAWHQELSKWFVYRVITSSSVPLAIAIIGTLLGTAAAMLLTYPHSLAFMLESSLFTGERSPPWHRALRFIQFTLARITGLISRGVPEVMWAFLFISFFGPGLLAGAVAIAIHTCGVLVRVFSETVDNIPYRRFEQGYLGSRPACFTYVAAPTSWRDWMTYTFFQFESNVRAGVVLGMIGVGGLGFYFNFNFEWFRFERAGTYLIMIIALTVIIDRISRALKLSRVARHT